MRAGLAIISLIVLAIHGVVFYKQLYAPWQDYQKEYFSRAVGEIGGWPTRPRIPQSQRIRPFRKLSKKGNSWKTYISLRVNLSKKNFDRHGRKSS